MRHTVNPVHEGCLALVAGQREHLTERGQFTLRGVVDGKRRCVDPALHAQRDALAVEPGQCVRMQRTAQQPQGAGRARGLMPAPHPGQACGVPTHEQQAAFGVAGQGEWFGHTAPAGVDQRHRGRAAILRVGSENAGRVAVGGGCLAGQRVALQTRQPPAATLQHPHTALGVRGQPPGHKAGLGHAHGDPAPAQVVHEHAPGQGHVEHTIAGHAQVGGHGVQRQRNRGLGQVGAAHHDGLAGGVPAAHHALRIERARHLVQRQQCRAAAGRGICRRFQLTFGRQPQRTARGVPAHTTPLPQRGPMGRCLQRPEARTVGVHQQSSGTTGTATAFACANGFGNARRFVGACAPSTTTMDNNSGNCQGCRLSVCWAPAWLRGSSAQSS